MINIFSVSFLKSSSYIVCFFFLKSAPLFAQEDCKKIENFIPGLCDHTGYGNTKAKAYAGLIQQIMQAAKRKNQYIKFDNDTKMKRIIFDLDNGTEKAKFKVSYSRTDNYSAQVKAPKFKSKKQK